MTPSIRALGLLASVTACGSGTSQPGTAPSPANQHVPAARQFRVAVLDLAARLPGTYSVPRWQPPIDSVRVDNLVPLKAESYEISIGVTARVLPPLNAPAGDNAAAGNSMKQLTELGEFIKSVQGDCSKTTAALKALFAQPTEAAVAAQIDIIEKTALDEIAQGRCTPDQVDQVESKVHALTRREFKIESVASDEDLIINVTRPGDAPGSIVTWNSTYAGEDRGDWRLLYSFLFAANAWPQYTYFTLPSGTQFQIDRRRSRSVVTPIAAVQYVFHGPTPILGGAPVAGLGFDLTKMSAHIGLVWTYHENVGISTGGVFMQARDLADRYHRGDLVATDLDDSQLTQQVFRFNPFIAISFRFGSTPFSPPVTTPTTTTSGK